MEYFYLETAFDNKICKPYRNLKEACYKLGRNRMLNKFFQDGLKRVLDDLRLNVDNLKKCQKSVIDDCIKLKGSGRRGMERRKAKRTGEFKKNGKKSSFI